MSAGTLSWHELRWQRPLDVERVAACLRQWATDQRSPDIVVETRMTRTEVTYLLGVPAGESSALGALIVIPGVRVTTLPEERAKVLAAGSLRISTRHRALTTTDPLDGIRAALSVSAQLRPGELLVVQTLLGPRRVPLAVPNQSPSSIVAPWYQVLWHGNGGTVDGEKRAALRLKVSDHGFACAVRLGVTAASAERRRGLVLALFSALRTFEAPGVQLKLRRERGSNVNDVATPWLWPLRLSVPELVGLTAWPLGDEPLPGQPAAHPRLLPAMADVLGSHRIIGNASEPAGQTLHLPIGQALQHLHVLGPTGTGKSTLLANLVLQDIAAGRGVVVIEPKGDLVEDILARLPAHRRDDVVILDPRDPSPVGLNPLASAGRRPDLVADNLLSVFKQLYGANVGPRSQDILYAGLLTLAHRSDASLVMLPLLLTNPGFRRSLTASLSDPLTLGPFWAGFEQWSASERANNVAPVMNKLRPLLRPGLRAVLGQREPRFDISSVLTERKILLVPLRRGVTGTEAASLLGSLLLSDLWQAIQARAATPAAQRHPVCVYVDEVQDYLHLPTDLGDALAQARGYGVAFTLAHQYLGQLPRGMREAILANARSRIAFQLPHDDAVALTKAHPELSAADLESLPRYNVYASLMSAGQVMPYVSGTTRPLPPPTGNPRDVRERSRARYGRPLDEVEASFAHMLESPLPEADLGTIGRRRRST